MNNWKGRCSKEKAGSGYVMKNIQHKKSNQLK